MPLRSTLPISGEYEHQQNGIAFGAEALVDP